LVGNGQVVLNLLGRDLIQDVDVHIERARCTVGFGQTPFAT
jgi:hypothetical protein